MKSEIEIKFATDPKDTEAAMEALGLLPSNGVTLPAPNTTREVCFFDTPKQLLFGPGSDGNSLILRSRLAVLGSSPSDVTLKLRGPKAPEADASYETSGADEPKFEGDQNVENPFPTPAFSWTQEMQTNDVQELHSGAKPISKLFAGELDSLFAQYGAGTAWAALCRFGPIVAQVWKIPLDGISGNVTIELWKVGPQQLRLLKVSDKRHPDEIESFAKAVRS